MKKVILSTLALVGLVSLVNAQATTPPNVAWSENFENFTLGSVGNDFTAATPGQGAIYMLNGTATDYQIEDNAPNGKGLVIMTGAGSANTDTRYAIHGNDATDTSGNYIKGTFDLYTGWGGGLGKGHITLFDPSTSGVAAIAGIGYNSETKGIFGTGRISNNGTVGYYHVSLTGANTTDTTWVKLGFVYNKSTGQIDWVTPQGTYNMNSNPAVTYHPNLVLEDIYIMGQGNPGNFGPNDFTFDNIHIEYSNTATLNLEDTVVKATGVKVYPNPTVDVLKITAKSKVDAVEIFDISGKKIDATVKNNEVDVRSYAPGTYMINVITKDGKTMTKFIKK